MGTAEIILALIQAARLSMEILEKHQRGQLSDEELAAAWAAMQTRLNSVSERIRQS